MSNPTFKRIAILNRGEPAMRFIIAAREYEQERGDPLHTIALYTEPDSRAMFVREADEAYPLGPATYTAADGQRTSSYLGYERLERALVDDRVEEVLGHRAAGAEDPDADGHLRGRRDAGQPQRDAGRVLAEGQRDGADVAAGRARLFQGPRFALRS